MSRCPIRFPLGTAYENLDQLHLRRAEPRVLDNGVDSQQFASSSRMKLDRFFAQIPQATRSTTATLCEAGYWPTKRQYPRFTGPGATLRSSSSKPPGETFSTSTILFPLARD